MSRVSTTFVDDEHVAHGMFHTPENDVEWPMGHPDVIASMGVEEEWRFAMDYGGRNGPRLHFLNPLFHEFLYCMKALPSEIKDQYYDNLRASDRDVKIVLQHRTRMHMASVLAARQFYAF